MQVVFPTSTDSVPAWLDAINLSRYKPHFEQHGLCEVAHLLDLSDERLQGAGVQLIGHRKRMLQAAKELLPPAPPAPPPPFMEPRIMDMDIDDDDDEPQPRRRDRSQNFGIPAASSVAQPAAVPAAEASQIPRRANSTSSIYISSTLTKPDTEEIVFCMAIVIHERIQQGEAQPTEVKQRFLFFSEDNNPLYAVPTERDSGADSSSDNSMKRARREVPTEDTIFHTIRSVFECAQIPAECLIVSLVYMERLIATAGCPILVTSWRPILLASLILAQKVWDDRSLHNVDFSVFCPMFTLKEINFLEKKFLGLIDYDVSITASLYASYYFQLRTLCQRVDRELSLKPMDVEAAAKLEARGVATTAKLRGQDSSRRYQSANAINAPSDVNGPSAFLTKLFS